MYNAKEANKKWADAHRDYLRAYALAWRKKNKIKIADYYKDYLPKWRKNNPEKVKELRQKNREKNRTLVLEAYGNKCKCCGESTKEFLSIDHIHGNGRKQRRDNNLNNAQAFYVWIRKNNYPKDFQILCHNCNCAKGYYGKCPHKNNENNN